MTYAAYLKCEVSKGMFAFEKAVRVLDKNGKAFEKMSEKYECFKPKITNY